MPIPTITPSPNDAMQKPKLAARSCPIGAPGVRIAAGYHFFPFANARASWEWSTRVELNASFSCIAPSRS